MQASLSQVPSAWQASAQKQTSAFSWQLGSGEPVIDEIQSLWTSTRVVMAVPSQGSAGQPGVPGS